MRNIAVLCIAIRKARRLLVGGREVYSTLRVFFLSPQPHIKKNYICWVCYFVVTCKVNITIKCNMCMYKKAPHGNAGR